MSGNEQKIHVKLVPFGQVPKELEVIEGTTVDQLLQQQGRTFSPVSVRVGGKSQPANTPLLDGQIVTTDIPRITVGVVT